MKKIAFLFICLFTMSLSVWAGNDKPIDVTEMPKAAQTTASKIRSSKKPPKL